MPYEQWQGTHNGHAACDGVDGAARDHHITVPFEPAPNLVVRISSKARTACGGPKPHPYYGDQLQVFGVKGVIPAEGKFSVRMARTNRHVCPDGEAG